MQEENIPLKESLKIFCKEMLKFVLILALILLIGAGLLFLLFLWSMSGTHYEHFGKSTTEEMENTFQITVNDNIHLDEYRAFECYDNNQELDLHAQNLERFMQENIDRNAVTNLEEEKLSGSNYDKKITFDYHENIHIWIYHTIAEDNCEVSLWID